MSILAWLVLFAVVVVVASIAWQHREAWSDRASRFPELAEAEVLFMEKSFRTNHPFPLIAKADRVYRRPNGELVLVELKTRKANCVFPSDVIQLSAQRSAVAAQTGRPVEPFAFVCIKRPDGRLHTHRVHLMSDAELVELWERRRKLLNGHGSPGYAANRRVCNACAWRSRCGQ